MPWVAGLCVASFISLSAPWYPAAIQHGRPAHARSLLLFQDLARQVEAATDQDTRGTIARQGAERIRDMRTRPRNPTRGRDDGLNRPRIVLIDLGDRPDGCGQWQQRVEEFSGVLRLFHANDQVDRTVR